MRFSFILILFIFSSPLTSQTTFAFAESLRVNYHIPEMAYAVVSSDEVKEMQVLGIKKINTNLKASINDKFRIGSNTKTITGFIAALLVKEGKIKWETKFFDLFPEMKSTSDPAHYKLTLLDLLSFRTNLYSYTYTYAKPEQKDFTGDETEQRYQFTNWFLKQKAVVDSNSIHFSNLGYTAAALMLEKVSGKSYKQLVKELGAKLNIDFNFGQPNSLDSLQPWGHDKNLIVEPPGDSYKLNWLLAAGNINVSLPDYVKFVQEQLRGLKGESTFLSVEEFNFLHTGLPEFAVGWFWEKDKFGHVVSSHRGNPGTFLSQVIVCKEKDTACLIFFNVQSDDGNTALDILSDRLMNNGN